MKIDTLKRLGDWIENENGQLIERQWDWGDGNTTIIQFQWLKNKVIADTIMYRNKSGYIYFDRVFDHRNFWQKLTVKIHFPEPYQPEQKKRVRYETT
jgi:hypothetical protein